MPTTVWVATADIYVGSGASFTLGYTPGNVVPDSVVAALGLSGSGLIQQATISADGTSADWRGVDPITRSELDDILATFQGGGTGAVASVNSKTGAVNLTAADIPETATQVFMTATERAKLGGVASGATANDSDANLRNRANHSGAQAISSITGLQSALDAAAVHPQRIYNGTDWPVRPNVAAGIAVYADSSLDQNAPPPPGALRYDRWFPHRNSPYWPAA